MTAPSIKEALEQIAADHDCGCVPCTGQCRSQESLRITVDEMRDIAREALATLQPSGERREAIALALAEKWPGDYMQGDDECEREPNALAYETADTAVLASGLVQNEAGILKAMEQECWTLRCVDIPTGGGDADVGWEVIQHHQAKPYERMIAHGRTPQEALTAAIRSARTGGES